MNGKGKIIYIYTQNTIYIFFYIIDVCVYICKYKFHLFIYTKWGFPGGSVVKNLPANTGDMGLISDLGRYSGEGNGKPLQYSCLGNPMDRGAWWSTVHGVAKSWTQLSNWTTSTTYTKYHRLLSCFSHVQLLVAPGTVAYQAPISMGFFRQEYWSGLPCPSWRDLPDPGIKPVSQVSCIGRRVIYY